MLLVTGSVSGECLSPACVVASLGLVSVGAAPATDSQRACAMTSASIGAGHACPLFITYHGHARLPGPSLPSQAPLLFIDCKSGAAERKEAAHLRPSQLALVHHDRHGIFRFRTFLTHSSYERTWTDALSSCVRDADAP
jgi:hypothetical protein